MLDSGVAGSRIPQSPSPHSREAIDEQRPEGTGRGDGGGGRPGGPAVRRPGPGSDGPRPRRVRIGWPPAFPTWPRAVVVPAGTELLATPISAHAASAGARGLPAVDPGRAAGRNRHRGDRRRAPTGALEVLILTDERGRIGASALRDGASEVRAEEARQSTSGAWKRTRPEGWDLPRTFGDSEFAVQSAMAAAVRIARDGKAAYEMTRTTPSDTPPPTPCCTS
ncbi:MAG: hypothetical protein MZU97_12335 [Bacillus subtilis]|nr:hypothetical protein [Bacillus subtilis]